MQKITNQIKAYFCKFSSQKLTTLNYTDCVAYSLVAVKTDNQPSYSFISTDQNWLTLDNYCLLYSGNWKLIWSSLEH